MSIVVKTTISAVLSFVSSAVAAEFRRPEDMVNTASNDTFDQAPAILAQAKLLPQPAETQDTGKQQKPFENNLTGDWGGLRSKLSDQGVQFEATYAGEVLAIVSGGERRGELYQGLLLTAADFDFDKIAHWKGGSARLSSLWSHGTEPDSRGDISGMTGSFFFEPSNLSAGDSYRFYEIWLQQELLDGRLSVRAGQLAADAEFLVSDYQSVFLGGTSGWPAFLSSTLPDGGPAYPVAGLGARVAYKLTDQLEAKAAIFEGDVGNQIDDNRHGIGFHLEREEGCFSIFELTYRLNQSKDATGLPGTYKLGGWHHSSEIAPSHGGIYVDADQMVYREKAGSDQGLGVFCRLTPWMEAKQSPMDFYASGGLHYLGLIPGRDADVVAFAANFGHVTDSFARENAMSYELAMELTYKFEVTPCWSVQPDVQYICRPGATTKLADSIVVGLRTVLAF